MEQEETTIDLTRLFHIMLERKKTIFGIVIGCTLAAVLLAFILPKTYESTAMVRAKSAGKLDLSGASVAMAALGVGGGAASPTMSYIEIMKSRTVLEPIIADLDLPEEKKEKMTNKKFIKKYLDIKNTKQTDIITITATAKSPEEAQKISQGVVDNFLLLMTDINKNEQSYMVKFLNERIVKAQKESDNAAQALENFSQEKKIYSPGDQGQAQLGKVLGYDKAIADLKVQQQAAQAQLANVNGQLEKQNANLTAYNISDNLSVQKIRDAIVSKEVDLVGLRQKYQDKHPSVIAAQEELAALQASLANEVSAAVASGTATMNPLQAELIKGQALASTNLSVAKASEAAIAVQQQKAEADMSQLSEDSLAYVKLQRDATMKNEIYVTLVKNCEQAKIQETMDSMDIQIVDSADLPNVHVFPSKTLFAVIGFILGGMAAFGYSLFLYRRNAL